MLVACSKRVQVTRWFWPPGPTQTEDSIPYLWLFKHWRWHLSCVSHRNNAGGWRIVKDFCVHCVHLFTKLPVETRNITSNSDFYGSGRGKDHLCPVIVFHWYRYHFLSSHMIQHVEHVAWKNIIKHMQVRALISLPFQWTPDKHTHFTHTLYTHTLYTHTSFLPFPSFLRPANVLCLTTRLKTALAPSLATPIV